MKVSIIIRALNEREKLQKLLAILRQQDYQGEIELILVDNESVDGTLELAQTEGMKTVTIPRDEFSYPKSLNLGAAAATGKILVFTVAHALPFNENWLSSGLHYFANPQVAGVYSPVLPLPGCTIWETLTYWPNYLLSRIRGPHPDKGKMLGILGATNCAIRKALWQEHPFDESRGLGGEDGEWADWARNQGLLIINNWQFAVKHSHGLGLMGLIEQNRYWLKLGGPTVFDRRELYFRKDLNFRR